MEEAPGPNRDNDNSSDQAARKNSIDESSFLGELSLLLYRPRPHSEEEMAITSSLSVIPWRINLRGSVSDQNDQHSEEALPEDETSQPHPNQISAFPSVSYLDLRRMQNLRFADDQCAKAQELWNASTRSSSVGNGNAAKAAWKQALELVPDHLPSLVGYSRYLLHTGKLQEAEEVVQEALEVDPDHLPAQTVLSELRTTQSRPLPLGETWKTTKTLTARDSSAFQNALLERQLLEDSPPKENYDRNGEASVSEEHSRRSRRRGRRRHNHRQKKHYRSKRKDRKRKRRHSRRRYYSSDDSSNSSSYMSSSRGSISHSDESSISLSQTSLNHASSSSKREMGTCPGEDGKYDPEINDSDRKNDRDDEESTRLKKHKKRKRRRRDPRRDRKEEASRKRKRRKKHGKRSRHDYD